MVKIENKKLTFIAAILTLVFLGVSAATLICNSTSSNSARYIGIKENGQMVSLKQQVHTNE